jgi:hypothetical protein
MTKEYMKLLPIHGRLFATARGIWRARLEKWPARPTPGRSLLRYKVRFEPAGQEEAERHLEVLVLNETWAARRAHPQYDRFVRRAIRSWLANGAGRAKRLLDLSSWSLVPYIETGKD